MYWTCVTPTRQFEPSARIRETHSSCPDQAPPPETIPLAGMLPDPQRQRRERDTNSEHEIRERRAEIAVRAAHAPRLGRVRCWPGRQPRWIHESCADSERCTRRSWHPARPRSPPLLRSRAGIWEPPGTRSQAVHPLDRRSVCLGPHHHVQDVSVCQALQPVA
jgi:hypothetical protein